MALVLVCVAAMGWMLSGCGGAGADAGPPQLPPPPVLDPVVLPGQIHSDLLIETFENGSNWKQVQRAVGQSILPLTLTSVWGVDSFAQLAHGGEFAETQVHSDAPASETLAHTYWVSAETPLLANPTDVHRTGSRATLFQKRTFRVKSASPRFRLVISAIDLEALEGNVFSGERCYSDSGRATDFECLIINQAAIEWHVVAHMLDAVRKAPRFETAFYFVQGDHTLWGWHEAWLASGYVSHGHTLEDVPHRFVFEENHDTLPSTRGARHVRWRLEAPIVLDLPIGNFAIGEVFSVETFQRATANARMGGEFYMRAFFRDPNSGSGVTIETEGLETVESTAPQPYTMPPAAECGGAPDPQAGVVQFVQSTQRTREGSEAMIEVVRSGGTKGDISVTLGTVDASAKAGTDYHALNRTIRFGDGQSGPARVRVETIDNDRVEPDRRIDLVLSNPRGCAALGTPATAQVTLIDDDAPTRFSLGGSVSGLVGSGLVLRNAGDSSSLPIFANGPFTFLGPLVAGMAYDVQVLTQPSNPIQTCRVAQGSGTIASASVSNVAVTCDPPAAPPPGNGALDPAFGSGGKATVGSHGFALATALQPDGKLVLLTDFQRLVRLLPDGRLDPGFGSGGVVNATLSGSALDQLRAVALQSDGGILVAGLARAGTNDDAGVRRYLSNGTPDNAFGSGGLARVDFNGQADDARAIVVQPDGRIVVAAQALGASTTTSDFGIARLDANGTLDPSFGNGGKVTLNVANFDLPAAISLHPDGRIVVAGRVANGGGSTPDTGVVRLLPDGQADTGFGNGGTARLALTADWDEAKAVVALPDGRVLLALEARPSPSAQFQQALARLKTDGAVDETFGSQGVALHAFSPGGDRSRALVVLADGRIVVAGLARAIVSSTTTRDDMLITRHAADGSLDTGFGSGGKLVIDFFGSTDSVQALALRPDGRIVAVGAAFNGGDAGAGVVQLLP